MALARFKKGEKEIHLSVGRGSARCWKGPDD